MLMVKIALSRKRRNLHPTYSILSYHSSSVNLLKPVSYDDLAKLD